MEEKKMEDWIPEALKQLSERQKEEIQTAMDDLRGILQRENASMAGVVVLMFYIACFVRINLDLMFNAEDFKIHIFKEIESLLFDEDRFKKIKKLFGSKVDLH